mmetsp:Transcript_5764/g.19112  ORF Transcript_5764/g.19112 Transcript_5764/m.19112 type:complete len:216 (-) Transcript_5764:364-1011(-)
MAYSVRAAAPSSRSRAIRSAASACRRSSYCLSRSCRLSRITAASCCAAHSRSEMARSSAHCRPSLVSSASCRRFSSSAAWACACSSITLRRRISRSLRDSASSCLRDRSRSMNESTSPRIDVARGIASASDARCVSESRPIRLTSAGEKSASPSAPDPSLFSVTSNSSIPPAWSAAARAASSAADLAFRSRRVSSNRRASFSRSFCRSTFSRCLR